MMEGYRMEWLGAHRCVCIVLCFAYIIRVEGLAVTAC